MGAQQSAAGLWRHFTAPAPSPTSHTHALPPLPSVYHLVWRHHQPRRCPPTHPAPPPPHPPTPPLPALPAPPPPPLPAPPPPPPPPAVTTFFGGTRFACATDHRLTDPVDIMMRPGSCPSAFSTGLEMTVRGAAVEGWRWLPCWLAGRPAASASSRRAALPVILAPRNAPTT